MAAKSSLEVRWLECGADHPLPSSVELEMGWSYICSSWLCLTRHAMKWPLPSQWRLTPELLTMQCKVKWTFKEVTILEFISHVWMSKILDCRIMFMCKPHVLLCKCVRHMKIKQMLVCHWETLFANCHNALHWDLNCCLQVIIHIKVDIFWVS